MDDQGVSEFLKILWEHKERGYILIWEATIENGAFKRKKSLFPETYIQATEIVTQCLNATPTPDIYVGVALRRDPLSENKRGGFDSIVGVCGLWADIDIQDDVHAAKSYPPTQEAAVGLINSTGLEPTIVVHTGHGLHAWWILSEPLYFDDAASRTKFQNTSNGWQRYLRERAQESGWTVDSTGDLARVLRVAGTTNNKAGDALPVTIVSTGPHYEDLDAFEERMQSLPGMNPGTGEIHITGDSTPPFDKFDAMVEIEPKFKGSWHHKRRDLDTSCSGYEQSLATLAVQADWSDQEIACLIVAHRKKWDPAKMAKLFRSCRQFGDFSYVKRTIERAKEGFLVGNSERDVTKAAVIDDVDTDENDNVSEREEKLKRLSTMFALHRELRLTNIRKVVKDDGSDYYFDIKDGRSVLIGGIDEITSNDNFRKKILDKLNVGPKRMSRVAWDSVVRMIHEILEQEVLEEATHKNQVLSWLGDYLRDRFPEEWAEGAEDSFAGKEPFFEEGRFFVNVENFVQYLNMQRSMRVKPRDIWIRFRAAGLASKRESRRISGKVYQRHYWSASTVVIRTLETDEKSVTPI